MIKETVADVVSSWVKEEESKQYCKNYLQCSLDQGIKVNMKDMDAASLAYQLEYLGKGLVNGKANVKQKLVQKLKELGKEKGEVILRPTIVGSLISMLFFGHRDQVIKGGSFTQKIAP
nr:hypothetical protein [Rickettsia endosymbiont of Ceutorhynchus assimilis]